MKVLWLVLFLASYAETSSASDACLVKVEDPNNFLVSVNAVPEAVKAEISFIRQDGAPTVFSLPLSKGTGSKYFADPDLACSYPFY